ncbi:MAG: DUF86 domain-containing protein [Chloroflexi bacterium]|nr:DUF86 domain-containing protein [Chloroflexota bacterium]
MVSPEVVRKRLRLLEGYLRKLQRIRTNTSPEDFLSDTDKQDIAERNLHLAIESLFDIGQHIIASSGWEPAEEYASIFATLRQHGVIADALFARTSGMAGFRNLLVHEYAGIDHSQVYAILQDHMGDLQELAHAFQDYVGEP